MRRIYGFVPLVAFSAFAGYYAFIDSTAAPDGFCKCERPTSWWPCKHRDGAREAEAAIRRGTHMLLIYGLPAYDDSHFADVMWADFQVVVRRVAGCVVDEPMANYVRDYNAVMQRALHEKFGYDVSVVADRKANALRREKR